MEIKIGNAIIKHDKHNWIVEEWGMVEVKDKKTKEIIETKYKKKSEVFPSTLKQALRSAMNLCIKESDANDVKSLLEAIKSVEYEIERVFKWCGT